jgi:hypothetical protein
MDPAEQLRALGGARTVFQLLSSKQSSQQKLAACVLAKCSSSEGVQVQIQQHAAALVQQILTTSDRDVRLRLLHAASCLKDCALLAVSETCLIDALKLVLADQDEAAAIAVCYLLIAQLNNNAAIAQFAAKADVSGLLFSMAAIGSQACKATALATLCTLLRASHQAKVLLLPEQIELLLVSALDIAVIDQLSAKSSTDVTHTAAAIATRPSCAALAARCLLRSLSLDDSATEEAVAAAGHIRPQLRLLKAAQRLLHCLSSQSSALQELAAVTLADALSEPLQRAASASTSTNKPASSRAAARRSSRDLASDTTSTTTIASSSADHDSIAAVLCSDGALRTLVWLLHSKSSAVAAAARTAVIALLQHHTHSVCAVVEQGCLPLLLMPCSNTTGTAAGAAAAAEMAAILQCLRSKLCGGELKRLLQTVKAPGNRELRSNVACGLVLLFDNSSTAAASLQQEFANSGALQAVVGMLRSSLYRPTGAAVLRLLAARTATLQPPADYFSTAAAAAAAAATGSAAAANSTDATMLILDDKAASGSSSSSNSSSDSSSGIRMACPPAAVLQQASPALGRALAAAAITTYTGITADGTVNGVDANNATDSLLLPLLRGRYAAWEEIMAHIGAPAAAAVAVTRLTVPQLTELFALTSAHGAAALADSYALELARKQQLLNQQQQQQETVVVVATAAEQRTAVLELVGVLEAALQCGQVWLCSEALKWFVAALGESGQHCAGTPLQLNRLVTVLHSALTVLLTGEQTQQ